MNLVNFLYHQMKSALLTELLISIALATFPVIYFFYTLHDRSAFSAQIEAFIAQGFIFIYTACLAAVYIIIALLRELFRNSFFKFLYVLFSELSTGILNVYRMGAGTLIGFPIVWYIGERSTFNLKKVAFLLVWAIAFVIFCAFVTAVFRLWASVFNETKEDPIRYKLWR